MKFLSQYVRGVVLVLALAVSGGCERLLDASRTIPGDNELMASLVAGRYIAGEYPGTINSTLDDATIVYHFTYQNGVTLWALLERYERSGALVLHEQVRASLAKYDRDRAYRPSLGDEPIDYLGSMAHATLEYYLTTGDDTYLDNALESAAYFRTEAARTPDGLIAYHEDPGRGRIWADALFMVTPLLAKAGTVLGDSTYHDDATRQLLGFSEKLRDGEAGLYHHGWNWHGDGPTPGFWSRANGWVALALVEVLGTLPTDHPDYVAVRDLYQDFAATLAAHQGPSGMWHQLIDRPDSYAETSGTAMIVYALRRGVQEGWLNEQEFGPHVERGMEALTMQIDLAGNISNICPGTGPQDSESDYFNRGPRTNDAHGIGPALLALLPNRA